MASRRNIKKDVNNLCFEVIYECLIFLEHTSSLNQENVYQIISDAAELRNTLICRINHPETDHNAPHGSRTIYRDIKKDLYDKTIYMIERLNKLPR